MKLSSINSKTVMSTLKFMITIPAAMIMRLKRKNLWIITERSQQARDNGYCFFKYLRTNEPQKDVYYIIDKKSEDCKKIEKYGNVIQFDSLKHYLYYTASKIHISAHIGGCAPTGGLLCRYLKYPFKIKDVFIPHGVSYGVSEFCLKKYARQDLFICSNVLEYNNILENYGYDENEVAYTGFPRLDYWWDNKKVNSNQIVLMPTWRLYLAQNPDTVFEKTSYYHAYSELIRSKALNDYLTENNLKLVFYLHNDMRKYVDSFTTDCPCIEIVSDDNTYDIQELLKSSAMLITDYSSVHFDFAYMAKPVVYYQFDQKEFFDKQYKHSAFTAEKHGFGPVCYSAEDVVNSVIDMHKNSFTMDDVYHKRMRDIYELYDRNNCKRVVDAIESEVV